tara:strand:- start:200 stop:427 length:228 start_codon:yes stop_codon:yes gene_type:complete
MKKNNIIIFSEHFIKKRIIEEGKKYINELVGECCECNGEGFINESNIEMVCICCDGTGIIYHDNEKLNCNIKKGV